jgi:hypothetical protein
VSPVDFRFPVGEFERPALPLAPEDRRHFIDEIAELPDLFEAALAGLSEAQLDTPYRPGGWTVRQLAHHVPDSHLNAYVRFKLALTEQVPTIKPYDEARWAELPDTAAVPVETSLRLLRALHERWSALLAALGDDDWARTYRHPELGSTLSLDHALAMYAWHGRHHTAHVTELRAREGW